MILKFSTISAAALVVGTLALAPLAASAVTSAPANVAVTADVAPTASISATTPVITNSWNGSAIEADPFTVTANTNAQGGYQFTFAGTNGGGNFNLIGTGTNTTTVPYSVTGTDVDGTTYTDGNLGTFTYPGPTPAGGTTSTFNVDLPTQAGVPADSYTDTLIVTITTVELT